MRIPTRLLLTLAVTVATAGATPAQDGSSSPYGGPLLVRPKLTGDWGGARSCLDDCGISFDLSTTQFYQGVASGGLSQRFPYGGRNDYFLNFDGEKLGLWDGLSVTLHGESRYGQSANLLTGALSPVNELLAVPVMQGAVTALTAVRLNQMVSESVLIYAGKINTFDDIRQPLTGATALEGFWNTSLIFNPIYARTLPYSTYGAGVAYLKGSEAIFSLAVLDTNNTPTVIGFNTFFDNGVTIFASARLPTQLFGLPGHHGLAGTYSNGRYTNLQPSPYLDPIQGLFLQPIPKTGSWCLSYTFDQAVYALPDDPDRVWGVFGHLGLADDNPNPLQWCTALGVSGASPIGGRGADTFGIGCYYLGVSPPLKRFAQPQVPLRNEQGIELYYNAAVTPWCHVTPDVQVIWPFQQNATTALLFGVRAKVDF